MSPNPEPAREGGLSRKIEDEAAAWLVRRDRGLTAEEQDRYLEWLHKDPRHAKAVARNAAVLERMMKLYSWEPGQSSDPNPDLFEPRRRRPRWLLPLGIAACLAFAAAGTWLVKSRREPAQAPMALRGYLKVNEVLSLPDGSRVELKDGSNVSVAFTKSERRVILRGGEAHFSVWKDASRPFYVEVHGIVVRAVGTAFDVRLDSHSVAVLVTEGKVKVFSAQKQASEADDPLIPVLAAGEKAVVPLEVSKQAPHPVVSSVSVAEISEQLDWQGPRLFFNETRLADAVADFNRLNRHRTIEISDRSLESIRIGGSFRSDNVEGFVRLLDATLGIKATQTPDGRTILRQ